ncbi:MAG: hypothetical protein K9K65_09100 [Desulfarculaceae bacterium]|nr:hypothetical protein [Desulfarculaceae bacterium]MCF8047499.1 hypothetical protein [Desulfarculaceae bacterium]MCF8064365.1 hypothetical protein [Desulfarculaceae bacterium]MCF8097985.1 hypothetical protein [Desulfarculaceae bacterium]MCF8120854.1 hypothetical protein [Desulfarculaceae bacterium]
MNQRTHAWIAIRAIKLLESENKVPQLIKLLKPHAKEAAIGAWIPDKRDAKLGGSKTQNHVFKMGPYNGNLKSRFVVSQKKLAKKLGSERLVTSFIAANDAILDQAWWKQPYKADPSPGQHLPNRAMALSINNIDMLILGDDRVQRLVPGRVQFIEKVRPTLKCSSGQIALFFFMLSHFLADAMMPCHSDERDLSDYDNGLHMQLEKHWSKKVGTFFTEKKLIKNNPSVSEVLKKAGEVDPAFGLEFQGIVPEMGSRDVWEEMVQVCRASFAVASIIAPPARWPYKPASQKPAPFDLLFEQDEPGRKLLAEVDRVIMHDAVLNVAMVWKHIWEKFS